MTFEEYLATGLRDFMANEFDVILEKFDPAPNSICPRIEGKVFLYDHFEIERNYKAYVVILSKPQAQTVELSSGILISPLDLECRVIFVPAQTTEDGHIFKVMSRYENTLAALMLNRRFIRGIQVDINVSFKNVSLETVQREIDSKNRKIYSGIKYLLPHQMGVAVNPSNN